MKALVQLVTMIGWIYGIILANGFVSTLVAVLFPFWAWYLVIEKIAIVNGWM